MSYPTNRERSDLTRTLKDFAFDESPMFQDDTTDGMQIERQFLFTDKLPKDISEKRRLRFEQTRIILGFSATRLTIEDSKKPGYVFNAWLSARRLVHPAELKLSEESWHDLQHECIEEASMEDVEDGDMLIEDIEVLSPDEVKEEIIDELIEAGAECEPYQSNNYAFSTSEPGIELTYERGTLINGTGYDVVASHDTSFMDDNWEHVKTPDGETLYIPPKLHPDEFEISVEIEVRQRFLEIIRGIGLDNEASMDILTPFEDKLADMLFLVRCMKNKRISLGS